LKFFGEKVQANSKQPQQSYHNGIKKNYPGHSQEGACLVVCFLSLGFSEFWE